MIHYHGTPITPRSELIKMAGLSFCVSYSDKRDADWCLSNATSVMWDNGAFSSFTQGRRFKPSDFAKWVEPRLSPLHWAVVPDVIGGDVNDQRVRISNWPHKAEVSAPVWHMNLPIDWMLEITDNWPRFCFGSSREYWSVGSDAWKRRADEAWDALVKRGLMPWVHMLRGLKLSGKQWPFASADSVNVARNYKSRRIDPLLMARKIDTQQCPIRWNNSIMANRQNVEGG